MPWLTNRKLCNCNVPEFFHSTERLTLDSKWQCPKCYKLYIIYKWGNVKLREHALGPNDYWYFADLRPA